MRRLATIALALVLALLPATTAAAASLTAAEVIEQGLALDSETVALTGEAIGEDLRADADHRWLNLRSGGNVVGVFVTNAQAETVTTYGSYSTSGDIVTVTGVLHVACDEHAGEFDIHAQTVEIAEEGQPIEHAIEWWKGAVGLVAAVIGLLEWRLFGRLREREDS